MLHMVVRVDANGVKSLVPFGQNLSREAADTLIQDIEGMQEKKPRKDCYETIPYEPGKKAEALASHNIHV